MNGITSTVGKIDQARYQSTGRQGLAVSLSHDDHNIDVRLLELTLTGAVLYTNEPIAIQEAVELTVQVAELSVNLDVLATVERCEIAEGERYYIRCVFWEEISESEVAKIAAAGYFERRSDKRNSISIPVRIQSELTGAKGISGSVVEYTVDGCRFLIFEPLELGSRIRLLFSDATAVTVRAVWQRPCETGQLIGCTFSDPGAYQIVQQHTGESGDRPQSVETPAPKATSLRLAPWAWMGMLVVLLWTVLQLYTAT
jgi:hypothetical protein